MNKKLSIGIVVMIAIVGVSIFAGCVEEEEVAATMPTSIPTSALSLSPTPAPQSEQKYPPIINNNNIIMGMGILDIAIRVIVVIGTVIGIYFGYHKYKIDRIEKKSPVILKIVEDFFKPAIDELNRDISNLNQINIHYFPEFLNFEFGISAISFKRDIYERFIKRKPLLKTKIEKYNNTCSGLNKKIEELRQEGEDKGLITIITRTRDLNRDAIVTRIEMDEKYEDEDITEILRERELDAKIEEIKIFVESEKLDKKAKNLIRKLEKIKGKYRDRYDLV